MTNPIDLPPDQTSLTFMTSISSNPTSIAYNPFRLPMRNRVLAGMAETALGLKKLALGYDLRPPGLPGAQFLQYTLNFLGVKLRTDDSEIDLDDVPATGPLLIVANHPLGGLEGVALAHLLLQRRPDLKILTNELLLRIPELRELFIGVDILSGNAAGRNTGGIRAALRHIGNGGALALFPAGVVSAINIRRRRIEDGPWNRFTGQLARRSGATCLPVYVRGRNSRLFYLLGLIHPRLRTAMLARELSNKSGALLDISFGRPVASDELRNLDSDRAVTHYLRLSTDILGSRRVRVGDPLAVRPMELPPRSRELDLAISGLDDCLLLEKDELGVYCAPHARLGPVMEQIGITREITFRAAGEGTGKAVDIDRFDPHYLHLFIWDRNARLVVGGYRIGQLDRILETSGLDGLYSRGLYRFDENYAERLGMALEMGRSFIHPDYQRRPSSMDLLWRGIGAYVAANPHYHTLFGAVSISREHSDLARALIADSMLESFRAEQRFLDDVRPVTPLKVQGKIWSREMLASLSHIAVLNKLVGRCDPGKAVPILLRHYLSLNGRFVCFSVNTGFNDSLDGLILVDLRKTPKKYLQRYLGKAGSEQFLQKWNVKCS